ncbi:MAG: ATP-dependent helicase [Alphaproteobacteria bacterium]
MDNLAVQQNDYTHGLNEDQVEAVDATEGAVLVLAGAGTGKTRVLITRLTHILKTGLARPNEVLAVTFTNKAAREMRERVEGLLGGMSQSLWIGTFHSLSVRILRRHAELLDLTSDFTILDMDDQNRLIKQILVADDIDPKKNPPKMINNMIQRWKDKGLTPERVSSDEIGTLANGKLVEIYKEYQARLQTLNAVDFGDLLLHCLTLFTKHPDISVRYQEQFRYILVDEYQDTNVAQYLWLRFLAQKHKNICCVGDDDQSIYGWRGAEVGNILKFEKDFEDATVIRLEQNYRSTRHILSAASRLIAHNEGRLGKELWTDKKEGEKITLRGCWDGDEEARIVGEQIENFMLKKYALDEMAILVRAGFQTRSFEERFITLGIPYKVIGGARFYERMEIRDAIAYLRVVIQPHDSLAFERIVNTPKRGLGDATLQKIHDLSRSKNIPVVQAAGMLVLSDDLRPAAKKALGKLLLDIDRWRGQMQDLSHTEITEIILDESGYTAMWQNSKEPDAPGRLENLKELIHAMEDFENIRGFLEHVSLVMENNDATDDPQVSIMTLHAAKGLEFETVFLPGWEEGLFPHQRSIDESGQEGLEEERRLAFVGITRAKERALISYASNRRIHGNWISSFPSRFVDELPEEDVDNIGNPNLRKKQPDLDSLEFEFDQTDWSGDGQIIEGTAQTLTYSETRSGFTRGQRVFHQKFGYGVIKDIDGDRLNIAFDKAGTKKVIDRFVAEI